MTNSKKYIVTTKDTGDGSGDLMIEFPPELITELGWREGDDVDYEIIDGVLIVKRKNN